MCGLCTCGQELLLESPAGCGKLPQVSVAIDDGARCFAGVRWRRMLPGCD